MREVSVLGFTPRSAAAPPGPEILRFARSRAAMILSRSRPFQFLAADELLTRQGWRSLGRRVQSQGLCAPIRQGQIEAEPRAPRQNNRALHHILQLSHVARPIILHQQCGILVRESHRGAIQLSGKAQGKVMREGRNVFTPLPERREHQGKDADSIEEVLPETPRRDFGSEISVGGGKEPHIHGSRPVVTDALELPLLQHPEQLAWFASGISAISSRNSVPPSACWKRPTRSRSAPVNAPLA